MMLRLKTFLIIGGAILGITAILYFAYRFSWLKSLLNLEEQSLQVDVRRVEEGIDHELAQLTSIAKFWSIWDDTYEFAAGQNPDFTAENLTPETFLNLDFDVILILDRSGELLYQGSFNPVTQSIDPLSSEQVDGFAVKTRLSQISAEQPTLAGMVDVPTGPYLVVFHTILPSDGNGAGNGIFVIGKKLDPDHFAALSNLTKVDFSLVPENEPTKLADVSQILPELQQSQGIVIAPLSNQKLEGYKLLADIDGQPFLVLRVGKSRFIYEYGKSAMTWFLWEIILTGIFAGLLAIFHLDRFVLRRTCEISRQVDEITSSGNLGRRLKIPGADELTRVSQAINQMLGALETSQTELGDAHAELEQKAIALSDVNQELESEIEERKSIEDTLQTKTRQQQKLIETAQQLTESLDVREVLERIGRGAREILEADRCVIYLLQKDGRTLVPKITIGDEYTDAIMECNLDIDSSLTGMAVKTRQGLIFNDAAASGVGTQIPGTPVENDERVIVAPLIVEGEVNGAICLDRNSVHFTQDELELVETFAVYASTALKNAGAHDQLQREVEERRQAEMALRKSEERYRNLVDNVPIALYRTDKDNHILEGNPALMRMMAIPDRKTMIQLSTPVFHVNPEDFDLQKVIIDRDGIVRGYEMQLRRMDGVLIWVRDTFQAVFDEEGHLLYNEGSLEDITEQKQAEMVQDALYKISQAALTASSLHELYALVHRIVGELMSARNFYIALYDPGTEMVGFDYFVDQFDEAPTPRRLSKGLTDYVIRTQKPLLALPDEFDDLIRRGEVESIGTPSLDWLGVPLVNSENQTFGAIVVQSYDEGMRYTHNDLNLMIIVSSQIAMAIERKRADDELKKQQFFLKQVIDINPNIIFAKDSQGRYTLANQAVADLFNLKVEEMLGRTDAEIHHQSSEAATFHQEDLDVIQSMKEKVIPEQLVTGANGKGHWFYTVKRPLLGISDEVQVLGVATDITARKSAEDQLTHNAFHDALTGLPNRLLFMDRLTQAIQRAKRRKENHWFALLFLDLDRFKTINDTLGHVLGDQLLIAAARRLQICLRSSDSIARFGGDEFVILLEDLVDSAEAQQVADRILVDINQPFTIASHEVRVSASIGLVYATYEYTRAEDMLRDADIAMYRAKALGRNRFVIFNSAMHTSVVEHLELEQDLRQAISLEQLELHYQPILAMKSKQIIGFEALLRWHHPQRGLVQPVDFIPFAEETGLILPIGEWVIHKACQQIAGWQKAYPDRPPLTVHINLSNKQFSQPELFKQIEDSLDESGLPAQSLKLEITESVIMDNAELAIATLTRLQKMGVQIQIDDFGTGYSSLAYLHLLPINAIKIDRSFVSGPSSKGSGLDIVQTIVKLAHDLHIEAVAEGVETEEQYHKLEDFNCEFAQGYLISKALDSRGVEKLLNSHTNSALQSKVVRSNHK